MQAGSSVSKMPARLTPTANGNFFNCGKPGHFAKECFSSKFSPRKNEGKNGYSKPQETGKSSSTYAETARRNIHRQEKL
jgi:hypothetical protein